MGREVGVDSGLWDSWEVGSGFERLMDLGSTVGLEVWFRKMFRNF